MTLAPLEMTVGFPVERFVRIGSKLPVVGLRRRLLLSGLLDAPLRYGSTVDDSRVSGERLNEPFRSHAPTWWDLSILQKESC